VDWRRIPGREQNRVALDCLEGIPGPRLLTGGVDRRPDVATQNDAAMRLSTAAVVSAPPGTGSGSPAREPTQLHIPHRPRLPGYAPRPRVAPSVNRHGQRPRSRPGMPEFLLDLLRWFVEESSRLEEMKHAPIRHRLEYLGYRALTRPLRKRGLEEVHRLGRRLGRLWWRVDRKHRRIADGNLRLVFPEFGEEKRRRIIRDCYQHFGLAFSEIFSAAGLDADEILNYTVFEGWEHVEAVRKEGRGILFTCGHYGNWQFAVWPVALRLGTLHVVARPPDNPLVARDARELRRRHGVVTLNRRGAGHRTFKLIRKGEGVGIVIDQRIRPRDHGIVIPFLGQPARSTPVPAFITARSGGVAIPMSCVWRPEEGHYRIRFSEPIEGRGKDDAAIEALARRLLEPIEKDIRSAPHYWLWMHRRWIMNAKSGPPPRFQYTEE